MIRTLALAAAVMLAGCAAQPEYVWRKQSATDQDWHQDSGQCRAQGFAVPGAPLMQVVLVFESCLQGKGWYKVQL